ncbi:aromatic ring-hydroxylating dioxygenase subunit alpha [Thalassovita mediterranea]|uniref:Toluene-4-sulfonate monooxygenase system iron-sulfur subunit TsaM1 n=1 Tax=Thalassovita mediterranea TaxID=340021 RepID=A0A0P1GMQ4_9RHOB|nr:aromatic ring-hydroxylating dioxygenase subunit alpha [Thalassovita mediterranea]MCG7574677.1 aromatic ring-hydroxylating dioxygenase subunit alpha [Phaeobacter sp. CNT1-3]CUH83656.1 Toluene-4-sulfonate monooxygenase system iron-sulfur subunit TsaM1 [Thalassovita mediterranea]SIS28761.1 vanillate O-demethylase monooxygenase subunit [Thalassovita mediterranea]
MFLKNAWYVAAWSQEITRDLQQIRVLGEKICVYRTSSDEVIALEDACPHRKLPLSKGRIKGDNVECGYHGLTFDCAGQCVWAPGTGRIPSAAKVRAYPVHEKYGLVWIWMGNAAMADPSEIFEIENYDNPDWGINRGAAMELQCNYLYMTDNLLDPTHVAWVHEGSFAQDATKDTPLRVKKTDEGVIVHRWMMDVEPAPFYKKVIGFKGNCDRLQHYEVRYPSHALIRAIFTPAGTGGPDGSLHPDTFIMDSYNFMTPTSERETRYYWFQLRNIRPDDAELSALMSEDVRKAFEEDRAVLDEVQIGMDEKTSPHIDLPIDGGQLRFRRQLQAMINEEQLVDQQMQDG